MNILEAVNTRVSWRAYTDQTIKATACEQLEQRIAQINEREGLHLQLCGPHEANGGVAVKMNEKMFAGPALHCIACVGPTDLVSREKLGYFGEELVLLATQLGLGTCWVASTYDQDSLHCDVASDEAVACIITVGYTPSKMPLKQRTIRAGIRAKTKKPAALIAGDVDNLPDWFMPAVECVLKAPTAINLQPVVFTWRDGFARASIPEQTRPIQDVDLGICKLHFKIGSQLTSTWEWGRDGRFLVDPS